MKIALLTKELVGVVALTALLFTQGCEQGSTDGKAPSQVVAKVNNTEITVHQLNYALSKENINQGIDTQKLSENVAKTLVNQSLIYEQAQNAKLNQDPEVSMDLQFAQRKVLVDTYIGRALQAVTPPTEQEVADYYAANPRIFTNRKVFAFTELIARNNSLEAIDKLLAERSLDSLNMDSLQAALKEQSIENLVFHKMSGVEQISSNVADLFYAADLKPGQLIKVPDVGVFYQIHTVISEPVTLELAKPMIQGYLFNEKRKQTIENLIKKLNEQASITYFGEFEKMNAQKINAQK